MYSIYQATNKINQKKYIGQTCQGLKTRMYQHKHQIKVHNNAFHNALRKYGWDNFEWSILKEGLTFDEANYWEEKFIKEHNTCCQDKGHRGYNIKRGGDNHTHSEESKQKMSIAQKGKKVSEEFKQKISIFVKKRYEDPEERKKSSITSKKMWENPEHRKKISIASKKMWENPEHRKKISIASKKMWENPEHRKNHSLKMTGQKRSDETKQKIRLIHQRRRIKTKILCEYPLAIPK